MFLFIFERKRDTQNLEQAPGSELSAQSPTLALNSQTVRSRPEPKSRVGHLTTEATQVPQVRTCSFFFFNVFIYFRDRERQSMSRGGAEREGDTESEAGFRL